MWALCFEGVDVGARGVSHDRGGQRWALITMFKKDFDAGCSPTAHAHKHMRLNTLAPTPMLSHGSRSTDTKSLSWGVKGHPGRGQIRTPSSFSADQTRIPSRAHTNTSSLLFFSFRSDWQAGVQWPTSTPNSALNSRSDYLAAMGEAVPLIVLSRLDQFTKNIRSKDFPLKRKRTKYLLYIPLDKNWICHTHWNQIKCVT